MSQAVGSLAVLSVCCLYRLRDGENIKATAPYWNLEYLAVFGLAVALFAGLMGPMFDDGLFAGQWLFVGATETSKVGRYPRYLFDIGVYFTVLGAIVALVLEMERHL